MGNQDFSTRSAAPATSSRAERDFQLNEQDQSLPVSHLLKPRSWPVRWRLALASAGLTLAILLVFAGVIGHLASDRVRGDFTRDLEHSAQALANEVQQPTIDGNLDPALTTLRLNRFVEPNGADARVYDTLGQPIAESQNAGDLGDNYLTPHSVGPMMVVTRQLFNEPTGASMGYVQYGRSSEQVDSTIARLWLFIVAGVFGGTLLASLAGLAIADRAMRPIASLTATARKIEATRDPSLKMPLPDTDDEVGELAMTLDQMLRSLEAAQIEQERSMVRQREFVADASHELRTPLTSVQANLEMLQASVGRAGDLDDLESVESALRSSRRMSRLIADLLLLAKADAGRLGHRGRIDLAEVAGDAAVEVAPMTGDRHLEIDNGRPIWVDGNSDELHRMLLNLLENAVNHTPPGSTIALRLASDEDTGEAIVEVADDGPGLPDGSREEIFDRFVRGTGPSDTVAVPGTGLGLSIVRAVAESHHGTVEALDSESGGALFRVLLPLHVNGPAPDRIQRF